MKNYMSSGGGSAFGGKKTLFILPAILFLAAGCTVPIPDTQNITPPPSQAQSQPQVKSQTKVDVMADSIIQSTASEELESSEATIVTSDDTIINGYSEVSNEIDY